MSSPFFNEPFSLSNEIVVITGGGTGIGLAIARAMTASGAQVVLVGRRARELEAAVKALGPKASFVVHDVTRFASASELVDRVMGDVGTPTCLVNNAGIHLKKPAVETTPEEFQQVLATHVLGAHALTRLVAPAMMAKKHGSILFISSMASIFGIPLVIAYTAAKTAMIGMVRGYATEFSPHGVRVNAIAPGWIETEMSRRALDDDPVRKNKIVGRTPIARLGASEDVGWAAVYLTSPAAKFVTGVVLPVDGGVSIGF